MEIDCEELNKFILSLFHENSSPTENHHEIKSEPMNSSSSNQQQQQQQQQQQNTTTGTTTNNNSIGNADSNENYYFVIFSNPRWSRILRKRTLNVPIVVRIPLNAMKTYLM